MAVGLQGQKKEHGPSFQHSWEAWLSYPKVVHEVASHIAIIYLRLP